MAAAALLLLLLLLLVPVPLLPLLAPGPGGALGNRHTVYWNSSNQHLRREGYTVQVNVNDYLDIYCPHYNSSGPGGGAEQYVLYMVSRAGYRSCNASQGFKRWECNRPHASHSPIKFSEKFQRYSAFSLGYEFHAGHEYYYISTPTHNLHWKCLRMKVFVCCASKDFEGENPQVPKLEKSISGTSPKREHLPLATRPMQRTDTFGDRETTAPSPSSPEPGPSSQDLPPSISVVPTHPPGPFSSALAVTFILCS
ncbi:ephrin-A3 isoform X2 [Eptesicus fuscus]|uniref:ephrin-A3 isoform X2 n=1 Tax=Eptesicus fuscus TaxID=29078 RepID=UPI002403C4B9|nr:ephrin-A3 isoform X2 [Eptesicus fuscus]